MKTKKQYKDSMMNFIIGVIGIILTLIVILVLNSASSQKQEHQDIEMELLNEMEIHWDSVNKETEDWTGTTQDEDTYMYGGYYCDTIYRMRYSSFADIPAGTTDTMIIVGEILYKMNDNKTQWIPIYLDE